MVLEQTCCSIKWHPDLQTCEFWLPPMLFEKLKGIKIRRWKRNIFIFSNGNFIDKKKKQAVKEIYTNKLKHGNP